MISRRTVIVAAVGLAGSAALSPASAAPSIKVVYVGGWDCPYCTEWKNKYKAAWLASPEYKKVAYVEVDPPKLREAYQQRYWPGDLEPILEQIPRKSGTPRWLIVKDGKLVANEFGVSKWSKIVDDIRKLVG
jgi:hypothetical protein